jgi:hypothetical protein
VIEHRLRQVVTAGRALLDSGEPGQALFAFIGAMALDWAAADQGLAQAIAGDVIDLDEVVPDAEAQFLELLGELLTSAQQAATVRADLTVQEVKAIIVACQAVQSYKPDVADRVTALVLDGLRPRS